MDKGLRIGDLYVRRPLLQGGMGIGISMSRLAAAVARAGGVGVLSAAQPGHREPDFDQDPKGANLRVLSEEIKRAKAASEGGVIGVNIMCAMKGYEDYVRCCIDSGADLIVSGAGLPTELPALTEGHDIKLAPIVSPPKTAQVLLKFWDRHYHRTADLVVIEGPLAGGHLGYSAEEVARLAEDAAAAGTPYSYDKEVLEILEIVKGYEDKYGHSIPVVFGGGVYDKDDIAHYLELGCAGVQMATRFVVTEECDAPQAYKDTYLRAKREDIQIVKSPVGMPGRAIRNPFIAAREHCRCPVQKCHQCLRKCNPAEIPYCITDALVNAVEGRVDDALLFCGENAWRLQEMTTVPALMEELFGESA